MKQVLFQRSFEACSKSFIEEIGVFSKAVIKKIQKKHVEQLQDEKKKSKKHAN